MSTLFGFYSLGLQSLQNAQLGLRVAGENIANVGTPGYARRRLELGTGYPMNFGFGFLTSGANPQTIRRMEDTLLQQAYERETGGLAYADRRAQALSGIEGVFGTLDSNALSGALNEFSAAFEELSGAPDDLSLRRTAIAKADQVARTIRDTRSRLREEQIALNAEVGYRVDEINTLAAELNRLNREIAAVEADGTTAGPLRDEQQRVVEELATLTGGRAVRLDGGGVAFGLDGGYTLVTGEAQAKNAQALTISRTADGTIRLLAGDGTDVTDRIRGGELGALLDVRDGTLGTQIDTLDTLATDLITRANAVTTGAFDLDGNPGIALFQPDPPPTADAAVRIEVNATVRDDVRLLAVSGTGAAGDGSAAGDLARIPTSPSGALGDRSPLDRIAEMIGDLGNQIRDSGVRREVAEGVRVDLENRRDAVSGVSLDEEAVDLLRFQSSYEASARFIRVLNEITELTVNLV